MKREVQPQDANSGLVERSWARTSPKGGELTERTLEGRKVRAKFLDPEGRLQQATGKVGRNTAGELVIKSRAADGAWREFVVTRDANVDVVGREPSR